MGVIVCKPGDPEAKGLVERANRYLETSFLPGRRFSTRPRPVGQPACAHHRSATIASAAAAMESADVSALLVEALGGIITERDIAGDGARCPGR